MLTNAQIHQFNTQGYLVVPDVLGKATLDAVRAEYSGLMDQLYADWFAQGRVKPPAQGLTFWDKLSIAYAAGCDWFQPMDISLPGDEISADTPMHFGPAIFDIITNQKLLDVVQSLIGPEITSNPIQHVRIKPPSPDLNKDEVRAHITSTAWHQDRGVTHEDGDKTNMVTVWIAITDATEENGCLQVIPGIDDGLLPHCPMTQTAIAPAFLKEDQAIPLPVPAGGLVLFHPLVPHASLPNQSDGFRWSFDVRFNVTGEPTGRSHFPEFVARSANDPSSELADWREWRSMWEAARERLATKSHIPIHRWQSDAPHCA